MRKGFAVEAGGTQEVRGKNHARQYTLSRSTEDRFYVFTGKYIK